MFSKTLEPEMLKSYQGFWRLVL